MRTLRGLVAVAAMCCVLAVAPRNAVADDCFLSSCSGAGWGQYLGWTGQTSGWTGYVQDYLSQTDWTSRNWSWPTDYRTASVVPWPRVRRDRPGVTVTEPATLLLLLSGVLGLGYVAARRREEST
jgi:PEP-CTERM motif